MLHGSCTPAIVNKSINLNFHRLTLSCTRFGTTIDNKNFGTELNSWGVFYSDASFREWKLVFKKTNNWIEFHTLKQMIRQTFYWKRRSLKGCCWVSGKALVQTGSWNNVFFPWLPLGFGSLGWIVYYSPMSNLPKMTLWLKLKMQLNYSYSRNLPWLHEVTLRNSINSNMFLNTFYSG